MKTYYQGTYSHPLVAVDVERLLRMLDRMPGLQVMTQVTSEDELPLADEEDGHIAELLHKLGDVGFRVHMKSQK